MTVYGDLTYATEIGMAVIVVGLGLPAIIGLKIEIVIILLLFFRPFFGQT